MPAATPATIGERCTVAEPEDFCNGVVESCCQPLPSGSRESQIAWAKNRVKHLEDSLDGTHCHHPAYHSRHRVLITATVEALLSSLVPPDRASFAIDTATLELR